MPKTKISEFSSTPASNTDIDSINIAEGCAPSGINDAIRELMAQLKDFQTGAVGDSFNGPVGSTTAATGAFTTLSATSTLGVTGVATFAAGTAALPAITTTGDTNTGIFFPAADTIAFAEGGAEAMRIDSSGNLGLGVTPSAWNSSYKVLQLNTQPAVWGSSDTLFLSVNQFQNTSGSNRYIANGFATQYRQDSGTHQWYTAASGTAGNAITFTQAMTLDASGNLGIGTTSPTYPLTVQANSSTQGIRLIGRASDNIANMSFVANNGSTEYAFINTGATYLAFGVNAAERARIDSSGNLLVGTTTNVIWNTTNLTGCIIGGNASSGGFSSIQISRSGDLCLLLNRLDSDGQIVAFARQGSQVGNISVTTSATAYNTSSDYRLKNTITPMTGALAKVAALKPVTYKWNVDGSYGEGFIAHELAEVCPQAVTGAKDDLDADGKPQYQGVDVSFLVATLTKAIQEQQAIIESLKARLDAANL